jgi:intraflagellar transport protein 52
MEEEKGGDSKGKSSKADKKTIIFNACKREQFHPNNGYKKLFRRLRANYKVSANKDDLSPDRLDEANVLVFGGPRERFTEHEIEELKSYVAKGGSLVFFVGEGGDTTNNTNMNAVIQDYGISIKSDAVVRTVYYKYLYPKEVFIANGILQPSVAASKNVGSKPSKTDTSKGGVAGDGVNGGLNFVYPYGATLDVARPATAILSSGPISYPLNRPIAAVFEAEAQSAFPGTSAAAQAAAASEGRSGPLPQGRVMVVGSSLLFSDEWLDKEENAKLADVFFKWLSQDKTAADLTEDRKDTDISEYTRIPNTKALAERMRSCLQEHDPLPKDFQKLFNDTLFKFDTDLIPEAVGLYEQMGVKHEILSLIPPSFESPLPPLNPAVFPPALRDLPPPPLDQFDLDEQFASSKQRLAQLANKCASDDIDYFVAEAGEVLGVTGELTGGKSPKHILHFILSELVKFKSINQEGLDQMGGDGQTASLMGDTLNMNFESTGRSRNSSPTMRNNNQDFGMSSEFDHRK